MLIVNGALHRPDGSVIPSGWLQIHQGKIAGIGEMTNCPPDSERWDAERHAITPGLIDAHCHIGIFEDSIGEMGEDGNEDTDPITPHLRGLDAVNPFDRCFADALAAGVTTVVTGPGSANPMGGQMCALKTFGRRVDDMVLKAPLALKCALGENPKRIYGERKASPITRMAIAGLLRQALFEARDYRRRSELSLSDEDSEPPEFDLKMESLLPVLRRELPIHFHAHRADDMFTAQRLADEFDLQYVLVHATEGHLVADLLAASGAPVIVGPSLSERSKPELRNLTFDTPRALHSAGVKMAICTDAPVIPIEYLPLCAALAARAGLPVRAALDAVTAAAAEICGLDDRVGGLRAGLDADIVVWSGSPLGFDSQPLAVFLDGVRRI